MECNNLTNYNVANTNQTNIEGIKNIAEVINNNIIHFYNIL
jgi:hypothetical protein